MYFCWKKRCIAESMLMEKRRLPALHLYLHHSQGWLWIAAANPFTSAHPPSPWHTSFTIILITIQLQWYMRKNGAQSLEVNPKATTSFSKAQLPTDRLPCLHVILLSPPLDVLKQGMLISLKRTSNQRVGAKFCLLVVHRYWGLNVINFNELAERGSSRIFSLCLIQSFWAQAAVLF